MHLVVAYNRLKTMENHIPSGPKKWLPSLTGGGCLLDAPTVRL